MVITILYDNTTFKDDLESDWGFACLIDVYDKKILFDTGDKGEILLRNMQKLGVKLSDIDEIFISHDHYDHTGGLKDILQQRDIKVHIPVSFKQSKDIPTANIINEKPVELHENIISTGEIANIEQSLLIVTKKGVFVIVGCAHSDLENVLAVASQYGRPIACIGGFHGFNKFSLLKDLEFICATHCTEFQEEIKSLYPEKYILGGVGKVLEFPIE